MATLPKKKSATEAEVPGRDRADYQAAIEAYGAAVRREILARAGRDVSAGAVFTALERLEARGYVSSSFGEATAARGGKRKRYYRIEPPGVRALARTHDALARMARGLSPKLRPS